MSDTQAELHAFLDDPETFKRAAEGSMAKRQAVLDQAELDEKLSRHGAEAGEMTETNRLYTKSEVNAIVEEVLDRLRGTGHSFEVEEYMDEYKNMVAIPLSAIEAERNKLKAGDDE